MNEEEKITKISLKKEYRNVSELLIHLRFTENDIILTKEL